MEKYKNLGRLIVDEKYYAPPAVDINDYNLQSDPHDIHHQFSTHAGPLSYTQGYENKNAVLQY